MTHITPINPLKHVAILLLLLSFPQAVPAAEPGKLTVSQGKLDPPKEVPAAVREKLDTAALTVAEGEENRLTIWFRGELRSAANEEQVTNGLTYRELPEGTLFAVVKFEKPFVDFRKQVIPAGVYTLRLAVQPDIGDHKETAPHQDFGLLVPAAIEKTPDDIEVKDLLAPSRKATGGDHPGVMLLFPYFGKDEAAKLVSKEGGVVCLQTRRAVAAGSRGTTLGFSLVIQGQSKAR